MSLLARLQDTDPDIVQNYLTTGNSQTLPAEMQTYISQINAVPAIAHRLGANMTRVVRELQRQYPGLNFSTARERFYDAMNFFHIDDNISADAWDNYYADKMEDLARLSISEDKLDTAKRCYDRAHELRTTAAARLKIGEWKAPVFIISSRVRPEDLGYAKKSLYDINRKAEDGFYVKLINSLPTTDKEKKRLATEAGIIDAEFEEIENE